KQSLQMDASLERLTNSLDKSIKQFDSTMDSMNDRLVAFYAFVYCLLYNIDFWHILQTNDIAENMLTNTEKKAHTLMILKKAYTKWAVTILYKFGTFEKVIRFFYSIHFVKLMKIKLFSANYEHVNLLFCTQMGLLFQFFKPNIYEKSTNKNVFIYPLYRFFIYCSSHSRFLVNYSCSSCHWHKLRSSTSNKVIRLCESGICKVLRAHPSSVIDSDGKNLIGCDNDDDDDDGGGISEMHSQNGDGETMRIKQQYLW
ncbi:hypothetical protein RFI_22462, partial [Reticulomyxa filosa]